MSNRNHWRGRIKAKASRGPGGRFTTTTAPPLHISNDMRALMARLVALDPDGWEAWYDDDENVPEGSSISTYRRILEERIAELEARE